MVTLHLAGGDKSSNLFRGAKPKEKSMAYKKITFEDNGQDFLTWTVDGKGNVVDCRPFQFYIWRSVIVDLNTVQPGVGVSFKIKGKGEVITLKHKTLKVEDVTPKDADRPVKCTSCKRVHPIDQREGVPDKKIEGGKCMVCPFCKGLSYYEVVKNTGGAK